MLQIRMRPAGAGEFQVEVEEGSTVQEVKVAATAGCDIDPELMRIVYKGGGCWTDLDLNISHVFW